MATIRSSCRPGSWFIASINVERLAIRMIAPTRHFTEVWRRRTQGTSRKARRVPALNVSPSLRAPHRPSMYYVAQFMREQSHTVVD